MKIKLDENRPASLADDLRELGHEVETVPGEGLGGHEDQDIFGAAQREKRFLITQDLDFSDIRKYEPGTHNGVMVVRLRRPGRSALRNRIHAIFQVEGIEDWSGGFIVVTETKLRIRRP